MLPEHWLEFTPGNLLHFNPAPVSGEEEDGRSHHRVAAD
jgi:hypothetical protein